MDTIPDSCIKCRKCEKVCPTLTLDIDNNTKGEYCIECYQCIAVCQCLSEDTNNEIIGPCFQIPVHPFDFELLMQQRRSVRDFKDQDVPKELLEEFIHRMRFCPTASNTQNLSFTVIKNKETLQLINNLTIQTLTSSFRKGVNNFTKLLITAFAGKKLFDQMNDSKSKFLRKADLDPNMICYNAPALIIIHAPKSLTAMPVNNANIWLGMATLYAQTLDLATCINGYIINAAKRNNSLLKALQIPDKNEVYGALLLGYPKTKYTNRIDRRMPEVEFI